MVMVCRFARGKWSLSLWLWRFSVVAVVPMLVSATSSWISAVVWPFCCTAPPDKQHIPQGQRSKGKCDTCVQTEHKYVLYCDVIVRHQCVPRLLLYQGQPQDGSKYLKHSMTIEEEKVWVIPTGFQQTYH